MHTRLVSRIVAIFPVLGLAAAGCSSARNDAAYGLMWYRPPPKPPAKSLTPCVTVIGSGMQIDRATFSRSEASNWEESSLSMGRLGQTASISSQAIRTPSTEAPWNPSAAVRSSESSFAPHIGGQVSESGNSEDRTARIEVGQPGCCTGLPAPPTPR